MRYNRIEYPKETEGIIISALRGADNTANTAVKTCLVFKAQRIPSSSQKVPEFYFRNVGIFSDAVMHANQPKLTPEQSLERKFREYADKWYKDTMRDSSITRMTSNVNYLKVIKLGPDVVPLILRELQSDPAPWFLALRVLTENTEVGRGYAGNFEKIAGAWISWGKERGLI